MKVLVIGSGPIVIGQAAEFDYAGTQACKSLREEGHSVVLVNSNPATIMTDPEVSDALYIEPLTVAFLERVIARERPDALLPTLGGQTGLNLATQLAEAGILEKYAIKVLGTPLSAIKKAEDREQFRNLMREIKEPVPESWIIRTELELEAILGEAPYPCIIRPAYTLGGTGGGIANSPEELWEIGRKGLRLSMQSQIMVERSLMGWKEVEYEVMRDSNGTCITVCNMENLDPMGVHTGDSIVVAPSQTLSDLEYHMLRTASLKIIQALGIEGGCNVQLAVSPESFDYYIIEVNPRVSRSSALASKATGYPIARVAAKIAVGRTLDEIDNQVTGTTKACFEPALDYCVVKIPRWPFDKFALGDRSLFTQMKATGEVMAIDRSFEAAFMKAIRGLEVKPKDLRHPGMKALPDEALARAISKPTDERLWALAEGLRRGWGVAEVNRLSRVDPWFLRRLVTLLSVEQELLGIASSRDSGAVAEAVRRAFLMGYPSPTILSLLDGEQPGEFGEVVRREIGAQKVMPVFKMVDTCAGEFESRTPYYYGTFETEDDAVVGGDPRPTVLVLGSGPIRIGQGIEFDYSCVHCVWSLRAMGYRAIIVNNNPETVSTDFDTGDGLYFEPVTLEDVLDVVAHEKPIGVVCQFGGQTAINLAEGLTRHGVKVLGTSAEAIALAEDREQFDALLASLGIARPRGRAVRSLEDAYTVAEEVGYPVLVRPSFVLGGRAMEIVFSREQLERFYGEAEDANPGQPVLVDHYLLGTEAELDVISDGEDTLVPGIMEHIERAGVHSGDSLAAYPPMTLSPTVQAEMVRSACALAKAIGVRGLLNIQFVVREGVPYVLEVNPRASRTVPYLSKVTGIPMVELGTRCMMGEKLRDLGFGSGLWVLSSTERAGPGRFGGFLTPDWAPNELSVTAIKAPVFSFQKLAKVEPSLGPEMKSTGEVLGVDRTFEGALYKALVASGITFKGDGLVILTVRDEDKAKAVEIARALVASGREIAGTPGTASALRAAGVACRSVNKIQDGSPNLLDLIMGGEVSLMVNTPGLTETSESEAARIRRACIETGVPCVTSIDTASAVVRALGVYENPEAAGCLRLEEYYV
jgi:carbamoyl-phosphate synthase large subunit